MLTGKKRTTPPCGHIFKPNKNTLNKFGRGCSKDHLYQIILKSDQKFWQNSGTVYTNLSK